MSLLILLASVAAMEFVLRREAVSRDDPQQEWARRHLGRAPVQAAPETSAPALAALASALERFGRGQVRPLPAHPAAPREAEIAGPRQGTERRS